MEPGSQPGQRWSRRQLLKVAGLTCLSAVAATISDELLIGSTGGDTAAAVALLRPGNGAPRATTEEKPQDVASRVAPGIQRTRYRSRPDLTAPMIGVTRTTTDLAPGLIFFTPNNGVAPDGPMIVTDSGDPIWIHPESSLSAVNLRVATYRGKQVLTWWEGKAAAGLGSGEYVIADATYREITRVHAGNGYQGDLHEFVISPQDTALFLMTNHVAASVHSPSGSPVPAGAAAPGNVIEAIVQEVEIASGRVIFEWHSLPSIDPLESYLAAPLNGAAFDYLHANSIDIDSDLLISGRHTWTV